ncbi:tRNA-(ms[2]io[6]A)-hydroxylase [Pseudofulvibacter geojedonensis]|uniref:tRNA-(Ms[2]io[6]A)-hydroxylase n=1 Tax=Pseudofulvibacter geojedonensis TaxID=1123758 RepID=A0ABW3HYF7_9FLAO
MLGLKLATDPRWVNIVEKDIHEILTDHAFCEQKAASSAISIAVKFSDRPELVSAMLELAQEELDHFKMVHDIVVKRGWVLGKERRDEYVRQLTKFFPKPKNESYNLVHKLLYSAMIEARSCERFRLLSEEINDSELQEFYRELMISEANHYTLFLKFARQYGEDIEVVNQKWNDLLAFEAELMSKLSVSGTIHG